MVSLMERLDGESGIVRMIYHGKDASPKITVRFRSQKEKFELVPPEDEVMEWYLHPHAYKGT